QCKGIVVYCKNIEGFAFNELFASHLSGSFLLTKPDDFFDEKESEIIFLKLQGQMSKSIARRLVSSPLDVENMLQELYYKAGVKHFDDFSEFCNKRNYHRYLPRRFIES
ncbi:transcriptional regulator, partial [Candidatus Symbiopectobacterium sp. NZEC127]|nr:transcriptional regulator [Candidatus Symbiopectobacterium sp. NZEC127]